MAAASRGITSPATSSNMYSPTCIIVRGVTNRKKKKKGDCIFHVLAQGSDFGHAKSSEHSTLDMKGKKTNCTGGGG
jgi:hypothetical protein